MPRICFASICLLAFILIGCLNFDQKAMNVVQEKQLSVRHTVELPNKLNCAVATINFSEDGELMATTHLRLLAPSHRASPGPVRWPYLFRVTRLDEFYGEICTLTFNDLQPWTAAFRSGSDEINFLTQNLAHVWTPSSYKRRDIPAGARVVSVDGNLLAGHSKEQDTSYLVDLNRNKTIWNLPESSGSPVGISPDNTTLATSKWINGENRIMMWDCRMRQLRSQFSSGISHSTQFSPDSRQFLTTKSLLKKSIILFDVALGRPLREWSAGNNANIIGFQFSLDGTRVVACGWKDIPNDTRTIGFILAWDARTGQLLEAVEDKVNWGITAAAFTPNKEFIVAGLPDGTVQFYGRKNIDWPIFSPNETQRSPFAADTGKLKTLPVEDSVD